MSWSQPSDETNPDTNPMEGAYRRYLQNLYVGGLVLLVLLVLILVVGIPHIQGSYTYLPPRQKGQIINTQQKVSAWYLSVTGWQQVRSGQYGQDGCPYILFIPAEECIDLSQAKATFPLSLFFEG